MDPLSIISSIYTAATELHAIYSQVKANKKQCATLNERVQAILPQVRLLEASLKEKVKQRMASGRLVSLEAADEVALGDQLFRLANILEDAIKLVTKFNEQNWLSRLIGKSDDSKDFADLNAYLSTLSDDLHLGVSVSAMFDTSKDAADAQADLQQLLAGQEEILEGQANLSARQEDIQSGVSGLHLLVQAQKDEVAARMHSQRQFFQAEILAGIELQKKQQHQELLSAARSSTSTSSPPIAAPTPPTRPSPVMAMLPDSSSSVAVSSSSPPSSLMTVTASLVQHAASLPDLLDLTGPFTLPQWLDAWIRQDGFKSSSDLHPRGEVTFKQLFELEQLLSPESTFPVRFEFITHFTFDPTAWKTISMAQLCSMLRANWAIKSLNLKDCALSDSDVVSLFDALAHNTQLTTLVYSTWFKSVGVQAVARMLCSNQTLTQLEFGLERVDHLDLLALAEAIQVNHTLQIIDLEARYDHGSMAAIKSALEVSATLRQVKIAWANTRVTLRDLPQSLSVEDDTWQITDSDYAKYFEQLTTVSDVLSDPNAFLRLFGAGLSDAQLRSVWLLADIDGDGRLNQHELVIALHLITGVRDHQRAMPPLLSKALAQEPPSSLHPPQVPWLDLTMAYTRPNWLEYSHLKQTLSALELDQLEQIYSSPMPPSNGSLTLKPEACSAGSALMPRLCSMLRANCAITRLNLSHCELSDSDVVSLLQSLAHNTHLESLWDLNLGQSAVPALVELLRTNRTLRVIDVASDPISDADFATLAQLIRDDSTLSDLTLRFEEKPISKSLALLQSALNQQPTLLKVPVKWSTGSIVMKSALRGQYQQPPAQVDPWEMADSDRVKYIAQFETQDLDEDGYLAGNAANAFLRRSGAGLTDAQLRSIWVLANHAVDSALDQDEFAVACHLMTSVRDYQRSLPLLLPAVLRLTQPLRPRKRLHGQLTQPQGLELALLLRDDLLWRENHKGS